MISVIVCSAREPSWDVHQNHVADTIGCRHEYLRIDNRGNQAGICTAYNDGARKAGGDILVFVHEDAFFLTKGWGAVIERKFGGDESIGIVGVAGTQYLFHDNPLWVAAGRPFIQGHVIHKRGDGHGYNLTVYSVLERDVEVVVVDGLFMAVRRVLFDRVRFDERTFDQFHFYDLDLCMQVRKTHRVMVTADLLLKHLSGGVFDKRWVAYAARFAGKYARELPASCVDTVPLAGNGNSFENFAVEQIMKPETVKIIESVGEERHRGLSESGS